MKLRKKDRVVLEQVLMDAKEGVGFLNRADTAVMIETRLTSQDVFTSPYYPEKRYASICKEIGTKLCSLHTAVSTLEKALQEA